MSRMGDDEKTPTHECRFLSLDQEGREGTCEMVRGG